MTTRTRAASSPPAARDPRWRPEFRHHRRCALEHAAAVRDLCLQDRSVLPRWHQDDRGRRAAHVGFHTVADDGAYSKIPVWGGRRHWIGFTVPIALALHPEVLQQCGVSKDLMLAWAQVKSGYAWDNGRRCIVRPDTLASVLGVTVGHVKKLNRCARLLGLEVVVLAGRMLTAEERFAVFDRGSRQRGLATEVALTIPRDLRGLVYSDTPHRGGVFNHQTHVNLHSPHGLTAERKEAAPRPRPRRSQAVTRASRRAADQLRQMQGFEWLQPEGSCRIAPTLQRFVAAGWTSHDLATALARRSWRFDYSVNVRPDRIRTRPAALLAHMLREIDPVADHPRLDTPLVPARCDNAACVGGWLVDLITTVDGRQVAVPCPRCRA